MTFHYAEENPGHRDTTTNIFRGNKMLLVIAGNLYRFPSRADRDAWVDENSSHRQPVSASDARRRHATGKLTEAEFDEDGKFMEIRTWAQNFL